MRVYRELPLESWIRVGKISLFSDSDRTGNRQDILARQEELYGQRIRAYLQTLTLAEGQELISVDNLMPPFTRDEYRLTSYGYRNLGNFVLWFTDNTRGKVTVLVERKRKGVVRFFPGFSTVETKLAEVTYEKIRRK